MSKLSQAQHEAMGIAMVAVIVKNDYIPTSLISKVTLKALISKGFIAYAPIGNGRIIPTLTAKGCRYAKQYFA